MKFRSDMEAMVLASLVDGPKHGYAIVKAVRTRSDDVFRLGEAQLYPVLHRMEESGWVTGVWEPVEGKPARKVYQLTDPGSKVLDQKRREWQEFSEAVGKLMVTGGTA